jgi:CHAD domain-containing protein
MRVALRRLRAALGTFAAPSALDRRVKAMQDALGRVRDRQLRMKWLKSLKTPGRALAAREKSPLADDERSMHDALHQWQARTSADVSRVARVLAPKGRIAGKRMRARLEKRLDVIARRLPAALAGLPPLATHRLRIAFKKLRYEAEIAALAEPDLYEALLDAVTPLQTLLGDLHDADVRTAWAEEEATHAEPARVDAALEVADRSRAERERIAAETLARLTAVRDERLVERLRALVAGT